MRAGIVVSMLGICACAPELALVPTTSEPTAAKLMSVVTIRGLPMELDPSDIEEVEILKGAAAAAIYGNAQHCGPIYITTTRRLSPLKSAATHTLTSRKHRLGRTSTK